MNKVISKKGISLVALVITIIVLIILTAAVVITGINTPANAEKAVRDYNMTVVQDAVTLYVMNEMFASIESFVPTTSDNTSSIATILGNIYKNGSWDGADTALDITLSDEELNDLFILDTESGKVSPKPAQSGN